VLCAAFAAPSLADEAEWKVLTEQARKHFGTGNEQQAEKFAREAVFEAERSFGENDARTADSLDVLARVLVLSGKPIEAEIQWRRVLRIRAGVLGPDSRVMAITYLNIASALIRSNQITAAEAEAMFARAARIIEKTDGRDSALYAAALFQLGTARVVVGQYAAGEDALKQALAIREKVDGPDSLETSRTLNNLALAAEGQGKAEEAKAYRHRALTILESVPVEVRK
jgi:serine/threonine-protein kinase